MPLGCTCWQHGAEYTGVQSMLEPMHAAVGKPNGGAPSKVLTGKIHVVCHNKTQKLFARHCVAKQCLGQTEPPRPSIFAMAIPTQVSLQKEAYGHIRFGNNDVEEPGLTL